MNIQKTSNKKLKTDWFFVVSILFFIGILFFMLMGQKLVLVNSYQVSSSIEVQSFDIGTNFMNQTISFRDENEKVVVLEDVFFEGDINASTIYVWRIGAFEWMSYLRNGYRYIVLDKDISR